jgi:hypothetical protein
MLALPDLFPEGSILVLEECAMVREIREAIAPFLVQPSLQVARQTLFPRSRQHHLPLTPEVVQVLADVSEANPPAAPQLCDHVSVYHGPTVLLEWSDAFCDNPLLLSGELEEASVRRFAARVGTHVQPFAV